MLDTLRPTSPSGPSPGRDQQFLARLRVMDLPLDLELHVAFQDRQQLGCGVREVFPTLARCIGP